MDQDAARPAVTHNVVRREDDQMTLAIFTQDDGTQLARNWTERSGNFGVVNNALVGTDPAGSIATVNSVSLSDVAVQAEGLVLRQDQDSAQTAIEAIGEREIHDPILPAERHGGLGPIARQGLEPRSFAARQNQRQNVSHRFRLLPL